VTLSPTETRPFSRIEIRPFRRSDRDQLTRLVNAHAAAVIPGASASVHAILGQLERQPDEFITDPWVSDRAVLVAVQGQRIAAAAYLLRYFADDRAGRSYQDLGEICWFLFWPQAPAENPWWPDATPAADALMAACLGQLSRWGVAGQAAGGELPVPGLYGVPDQWPHVAACYQRAGFAHTGPTEVVYLARTRDLARPADPPLAGLAVRRTVGINGTRLSAALGDESLGYIEVEALDDGERRSRRSGWADVGNLHVAAGHRRRGIATWLLGQAAGWLELAGAGQLLAYAGLDDADPSGHQDAGRAFLTAAGFRELTRTARGWTRDPCPT
jgi:GNAT superfamily N-acetyltransferase